MLERQFEYLRPKLSSAFRSLKSDEIQLMLRKWFHNFLVHKVKGEMRNLNLSPKPSLTISLNNVLGYIDLEKLCTENNERMDQHERQAG